MERIRASSLEANRQALDSVQEFPNQLNPNLRRCRINSLISSGRDCSDESLSYDTYSGRNQRLNRNEDLRNQIDILQLTVNRMLNPENYDGAPSVNLSDALKHEYRQMMNALKELENTLVSRKKNPETEVFTGSNISQETELKMQQMQREIHYRDSLIKCLSERLKVLCKANDKLIIDYESQESLLSEELVYLKRQLEKAKDAMRALSLLKSRQSMSTIHETEKELYYLRESMHTKEMMISDLKHRVERLSRENADLRCELDAKTEQSEREEQLREKVDCKSRLIRDLQQQLDCLSSTNEDMVKEMRDENELAKEELVEMRASLNQLCEELQCRDETIVDLRSSMHRLMESASALPVRDEHRRSAESKSGNELSELLAVVRRNISQHQPQLLHLIDNELDTYHSLEKLFQQLINMTQASGNNELFKEYLSNAHELKNRIAQQLSQTLPSDLEFLKKLKVELDSIGKQNMDLSFQNNLCAYLQQSLLSDKYIKEAIDYVMLKLQSLPNKNISEMSLVVRNALYDPVEDRSTYQSYDTRGTFAPVSQKSQVSTQQHEHHQDKVRNMEKELQVLNKIYKHDRELYAEKLQTKNEEIENLIKQLNALQSEAQPKTDIEFLKQPSENEETHEFQKLQQDLVKCQARVRELEREFSDNKKPDASELLKKLNDENSKLKIDLSSTQAKLMQIEQLSVNRTVTELTNFDIKQKDFKSELEHVTQQHNSLLDKYKHVKMDNDRLTEEMEILTNKLRKSERELTMKDQEVTSLNESLAKFKQYKTENEKLTEELDELRVKMKRSMRDTNEQNSEIVKLNETITKLEKCKLENSRLLDELQTINSQLKLKTSAVLSKPSEVTENPSEINSRMQACRREIERVTEENEDLRSKLRQQEKDISQKTSDLESISQKSHRFQVIQSQNEQLIEEMLTLKSKIKNLEHELTLKNSELENLEKSMRKLSSKVSNLSTTNETMKSLIDEAKDAELNKLTEELRECRRQSEQYRRTVESEMSMLNDKLEQVQLKERELEKLRRHNQQLSSELETLEQLQQQNRELRQELDRVRIEKDSLKSTLAQFRQMEELKQATAAVTDSSDALVMMEKLQTEINDLAGRLVECSGERDAARADVVDLQVRLVDQQTEQTQAVVLRSSIGSLKIENKSLEMRASSLGTEKTCLENQVRELKRRLSEIARDCSENHVCRTSVVQTDNDVEGVCQQKIIDLESILACMTDELNEKSRNLEELRQVVHNPEFTTNAEPPLRDCETPDIVSDYNQQLILQKESEITYLKSVLREKEEQATLNRTSGRDRQASSSLEVQEGRQEIQRLHNKVLELQEHVATLSSQLNDKGEHVSQLQHLLMEKDEVIANATNMICTKSQSLSKSEKEVQRLSQDQANVKEVLSTKFEDEHQTSLLRSENQILATEIDRLQGELTDCKDQLLRQSTLIHNSGSTVIFKAPSQTLEKLNSQHSISRTNAKPQQVLTPAQPAVILSETIRTSAQPPIVTQHLQASSLSRPNDTSVEQISNEIQKLYVDFEEKNNEIKEYSLSEIKNRDKTIDNLNLELKIKSDHLSSIVIENRRLASMVEDESQKSGRIEQNLVLKEQLLQQLSKDKDKIRATFITELKTKTEQLDEKTKTVYFLNAELHRLSSQLEIVSGELQAIKTTDRFSVSQQHCLEITENTILDSLKHENESLKLCINLKLAETDALKREVTVHQIQKQQLSGEVGQLKENLDKQNLDIVRGSQQHEQVERSVKIMEKDCEERLTEMTRKLENLQEDYYTLINTKNKLDKNNEMLEKRLSSLDLEKEHLKRQLSDFIKENESQKEKIRSLQENLDISKEEIQITKIEFGSKSTEISELHLMISSQETLLDEKSLELNISFQQIEELSREASEYRLKIESLSIRLVAIESFDKTLTDKMENDLVFLREKEKRIKFLERENENMQDELIQYKELEKQLDACLKRKSIDCDTLQSEYDNLLKRFEQYQESLENVEKQERNNRKSSEMQYQQQCDELKDQLQRAKEDLKNLDDKWKMNSGQWTDKYADLAHAYEQLEYEFMQIQHQLDSAKQENDCLDDRLNDQSKKLSQLTDAYDKLERENHRLMNEIDCQQANLEHHRHHVCENEESLEMELNVNNEELSCRNLELREKVESLSCEMVAAHSQICDLSAKLGDSQLKFSELYQCLRVTTEAETPIPTIQAGRRYGSHPSLMNIDQQPEADDFCDLKNRYDALCSQVDRLSGQLRKKDRRLSESQNELDRTTADKASESELLLRQYHEICGKHQQLALDFGALESRAQQLALENDKLQQWGRSLAEDRNDEMESLRQSLACHTDQLEQLKLVNESLQHEYQISLDRLKEMENDLKQANTELEEWRNNCFDHTNYSQDLEQRYQQSHQQLSEALVQLEKQAELNEELQCKTRTLNNLLEVNHKLDQQISEQQDSLKMQQDTIESYRSKLVELETFYEEQVDSCRQDVAKLKYNEQLFSNDYSAEITVKQQELEFMTCRNQDIEAEMCQLKQEYANCCQSLADTKVDYERQQQKLEDLSVKAEHLSAQMFDKSSLIEQLTCDNQQLQSELEIGRCKLDHLTKKMDSMAGYMTGKENEACQMKESVESLNRYVSDKEDEYCQLKQGMDEMNKALGDANRQLEELGEELNRRDLEKMSFVSQFKKELTECYEDMTGMKETIRRLEGENSRMAQQLTERYDTSDGSQRDRSHELAELRQENTRLLNQLYLLKQSVNEGDSSFLLEQLKCDNAALLNQLELLRSQVTATTQTGVVSTTNYVTGSPSPISDFVGGNTTTTTVSPSIQPLQAQQTEPLQQLKQAKELRQESMRSASAHLATSSPDRPKESVAASNFSPSSAPSGRGGNSDYTYTSSKSVTWNTTHTPETGLAHVPSTVHDLENAIDEYETLVAGIEAHQEQDQLLHSQDAEIGHLSPQEEAISEQQRQMAPGSVRPDTADDSNLLLSAEIAGQLRSGSVSPDGGGSSSGQHMDELNIVVVDVGPLVAPLSQQNTQTVPLHQVDQFGGGAQQSTLDSIIKILKKADISIEYDEHHEPFQQYVDRVMQRYNELEQFYSASIKIQSQQPLQDDMLTAIKALDGDFANMNERLTHSSHQLNAPSTLSTAEANIDLPVTSNHQFIVEDNKFIQNALEIQQQQLSATRTASQQLEKIDDMTGPNRQSVHSVELTGDYETLIQQPSSSVMVMGAAPLVTNVQPSTSSRAQVALFQGVQSGLIDQFVDLSFLNSASVLPVFVQSTKHSSKTASKHSVTKSLNDDMDDTIIMASDKSITVSLDGIIQDAINIVYTMEKQTEEERYRNDSKRVVLGQTHDIMKQTDSVVQYDQNEDQHQVSVVHVIQQSSDQRHMVDQQRYNEGVSVSESKTKALDKPEESVSYASISQLEKEMHSIDLLNYDNIDSHISSHDRQRIYAAEMDYLNEKNLFISYAINMMLDLSKLSQNSEIIDSLDASLAVKGKQIMMLQKEFKFELHITKKEKNLINKILDPNTNFSYRTLFDHWMQLQQKLLTSPTRAEVPSLAGAAKAASQHPTSSGPTAVPATKQSTSMKDYSLIVSPQQKQSSQSITEDVINLRKENEDLRRQISISISQAKLANNSIADKEDMERQVEQLRNTVIKTRRENEELKTLLTKPSVADANPTASTPVLGRQSSINKHSKIPLLKGSSFENPSIPEKKPEVRFDEIERKAVADISNASKTIIDIAELLAPFKNADMHVADLSLASMELNRAAERLNGSIRDMKGPVKDTIDAALMKTTGQMISPEDIRKAIKNETSIENMRRFANLLAEDNFDLASEIEKLLNTIEELRKQLKENCDILSETVEMLQNSENLVNDLEAKIDEETKKTKVLTLRMNKHNQMNRIVINEVKRMLRNRPPDEITDMDSQQRYDYLLLCLRQYDKEKKEVIAYKDKVEGELNMIKSSNLYTLLGSGAAAGLDFEFETTMMPTGTIEGVVKFFQSSDRSNQLGISFEMHTHKDDRDQMDDRRNQSIDRPGLVGSQSTFVIEREPTGGPTPLSASQISGQTSNLGTEENNNNSQSAGLYDYNRHHNSRTGSPLVHLSPISSVSLPSLPLSSSSSDSQLFVTSKQELLQPTNIIYSSFVSESFVINADQVTILEQANTNNSCCSSCIDLAVSQLLLSSSSTPTPARLPLQQPPRAQSLANLIAPQTSYARYNYRKPIYFRNIGNNR